MKFSTTAKDWSCVGFLLSCIAVKSRPFWNTPPVLISWGDATRPSFSFDISNWWYILPCWCGHCITLCSRESIKIFYVSISTDVTMPAAWLVGQENSRCILMHFIIARPIGVLVNILQGKIVVLLIRFRRFLIHWSFNLSNREMASKSEPC